MEQSCRLKLEDNGELSPGALNQRTSSVSDSNLSDIADHRFANILIPGGTKTGLGALAEQYEKR